MVAESPGGWPVFTAAAVQAAPAYLDREATVDKACRLIHEAGRAGARLIAFPEVFVPGFPHWIYLDRPHANEGYFVELVREAVDVPGPSTERIGRAARAAAAWVVIGVNERSRRSAGELFNTNLIFGPDGALLGHHRKLMPTYAEKMIWSFGDGSTLRVHDTGVGRLGTLVCGENTNPLARFALIAQGEQVHVANYPARPAGDAYDLRRAIEIRSAAHAFEGKCFVVVAGSVISDEMRRMLGDTPEKQRLLGNRSTTFTGILGPDGDIVAGPAAGDAETIVYGEIDLERIIRAKLIHDIAGNYNRFDVLSLTVNRAPLTALREVVEPARPGPASSTVTRSLTASADPVGERVMPAGQHERLGNMRERMRVGAAQVAPKFLDKAGTIRKVGATLEEAGRLGLDLIVFPETFIAAYPYWRGTVSVRRSTELCAAMQREAVRIPSDDTDALCEMARRSNVNCVVGLNELDDRPGSLTMYNTLLVIARDGRILGRHRKLVPTHSERVYWGMGDARDIRVFATDLGRLGGLVCYEHHMTLLRAALADLGEELHVAVWPGWWTMDGHLGAKRPEAGARACDIEPAIREYAIENSVFVVSSSWYLPPGEVPDNVADAMQYNLAIGGSCIVNPSGLWVREPVFSTETIVWAEIDQDERRVAKAYFDSVGHYARRDLLRLVLNPGAACEGAAQVLEPSGARLREAAEQSDVRLARLEALVERLVNSIPSAPRPDVE